MQTPTPRDDPSVVDSIMDQLKKIDAGHTPEAKQERHKREDFGEDENLYILTNLSRPPEALAGQRGLVTKVAFRGKKGGLVYRPVIGIDKTTGKTILGKPIRPSKVQMDQFRKSQYIKGCVQGCGL